MTFLVTSAVTNHDFFGNFCCCKSWLVGNFCCWVLL